MNSKAAMYYRQAMDAMIEGLRLGLSTTGDLDETQLLLLRAVQSAVELRDALTSLEGSAP